MRILDSIEAIAEFSKGATRAELERNRMKRSAIVREIEVIGEAAKNVSAQVKGRHGEVMWKEIAATRDKMIHHYFGVDLDVVLAIARKDLPVLKRQMLAIEKELKES